MSFEELCLEADGLLNQNPQIPVNFLIARSDFNKYYLQHRDRIAKFDSKVYEYCNVGSRGDMLIASPVSVALYAFKSSLDEENVLFVLKLPCRMFYDLGYEFIDAKSRLTSFMDLTNKCAVDFYFAKGYQRHQRQIAKAKIRDIWREIDTDLGRNPDDGEF
jgi:hypothetical protein